MATPAARGPQSGKRRRGLRLLAVFGALLLALVVAGAVGGLWLLRSESGRDFALARLSAALPAGSVHWQRAEGTLGGGVTLHGLRLDQESMRIQARQVRIELAPLALLGRTLRIESLQVDGVDWQFVEPPQPALDEQGLSLRMPNLQLPIAIELHNAHLRQARIRSGQDLLLEVRSLTLAGRVQRDGRLRIRELALDADRGQLTGEGRIDLDGTLSGDATLRWTGPGGGTLRIDLDGRRDASRLQVLDEARPSQALVLVLQGERWQLDSTVEGFDPRPWFPDWPHGPVTAVIEGRGEGWSGTLAGRAGLGDLELVLRPSTLALIDEGQALQVDPLHLALADGGTARIHGRLALTGEHAADLVATLQDVAFSREPPRRLSGELIAKGSIDGYTLAFDGIVDAEGEPVAVNLAATGDAHGLVFTRLHARSEGSELVGEGRVAWSPHTQLMLDARLQDFDPSRFVPELPGSVSGALRLELVLTDPWRLDAQFQDIGGTLRGRALRAEGRLALGPDPAPSDLDFQLGESHVRVRGRAGPELDLRAELAPLRLSDLLPDAAGEISGTLQASGPRAAARWQAELAVQGLDLAGVRAGDATLRGEYSAGAGGAGHLDFAGEDLQFAGQRFATARVRASGRLDAHTIEVDAEGETSVQALLEAGYGNDTWSGQLRELAIAPARIPRLELDAPAAFSIGADALEIDRACLAGGQARLCAQAHTAGQVQSLQVELDALPLALAEPWLAPDRAVPVSIEGNARGRLHWQRDARDERLDFELTLAQGELALAGVERRALLAWQDLQLQGAIAEGRLQAELTGTLEQGGRIDARLEGASPLADPGAAMTGTLSLSLPRLRVLELLAPQVANPSGRLEATLDLAGSWDDPAATGTVAIESLSGELPGMGIAIQDGTLTLRSSGQDSMQVSGSLPTGEGTLRVDGTLNRLAAAPSLELTVTGERVLMADTPLVRAVVSPDLTLTYAERRLEFGGSLGIPEGRLDLDYLDDTVQPSPDVVVLDPREGAAQDAPIAVHGRVEVTLGEAVLLLGYGFDGRVAGTVNIRERPGRLATARGRLELSGQYEAYGQQLEIVRGRLLYSNSPLDNPALDLRAEREIQEQTVGLDIGGTALTPMVRVYSNPALPEAEALGYLVLGRPLSAATEADSAQLSQAAVAVGGNLLAEKLGSRLGFDTFGVSDSRTLGGSAFTVGKYLSPKLYVSYGVSLFGTGEVLGFNYLLNEHWQVELESGQENRVGLKYRIER
ncbi:MAG TPA: translocation/assembly module TamB domain-containing protein [Xanthomonadaceae bacterium]|nr:translocation/assembly module TamB domain-containing protein [Xanthomonadaceae bacterium]